MLRRGFVAAVVALAFGGPAQAQTNDAHDFMNGVYASSKKDCATLAKGGLSAIEEGAVLTSEGVRAYEYFCDFVDIKPRPGPNQGWVATGFCEEPDDQYPELVAIAPFGEDSVRAIFMTDFTRDEGPVTGGDDDSPDDDDGGSNVSPPSDQTAEVKGISDPGGDDDGTGDDDGGVDPGPGGDDIGGVGPGGDDDGPGVGGDDDSGDDEANFNEFFFCAGVSKDKLK